MDLVHQTIKHLSNVNDSYPIALQLLKDQFLDIPFIVDESLNPNSQLLTRTPLVSVIYS